LSVYLSHPPSFLLHLYTANETTTRHLNFSSTPFSKTIYCIVQTTKENLETLKIVSLDLKSKVTENTKKIGKNQVELESVTAEIRTLASRSDTRALARELESHAAAIQQCAKVTEVEQVKEYLSFRKPWM
jgi:hypothetical protein